MNDRKFEQLSAMIDGQLTERDSRLLMDGTREDPELKAAWLRYHIIGDALRENLPRHICPDFATRISRALENEPVILVPKRRPVHHWFKPAFGLAMAASVVAAIGLGVFKSGTDIPPVPPQKQVPVAVAEVEPQFAPLPIATVRWNSGRPRTPSRLNSYLVNHNQFKADVGMQGVSPYYRVIGYETSP
jgi:sigma-E factor negative regulatory protein RseA